MGYLKNQEALNNFGKRLKALRLAADLSQEQVYLATGIGQSHIAKMELGQLSTSLSHIALLSELFGIEDYELLQYKEPVLDGELLKKNISKFLKSRGMDPAVFLKSQGATHIIEEKLLPTKFLNTPRFTIEIVEYCEEKFEAKFTTSQISKALDGLRKRGLLEKMKTDKKTKFQYSKKH